MRNTKRKILPTSWLTRGLVFILAATLMATTPLSRVSADAGDLDTSFGTNGFVVTDAQRRILAAGYINKLPQQDVDLDFALARYNPDGSLDTSFGSQGKVIRNYSSFDVIEEIALRSDGKIVVAGTTRDADADVDFALFRLTSAGRPDSTFAGGQIVLTDFYGMPDQCHALVLQSDGRIIVGGECRKVNRIYFALARYNANGTLDASFGGDGKVTTSFSGDLNQCWDLVLRPTHYGGEQIIAAGSRYLAMGSTIYVDFAMACYLPDGSLNYGFGIGGKVVTDFSGDYDFAYNALLQQDGKTILAGSSSGNFALTRYHASGSLDTSFGNGGRVITDAGYQINEVALDARGEIVAAGEASPSNIVIAKYLP